MAKKTQTVRTPTTDTRRLTLSYFERESDEVQQIADMLAAKKSLAVTNIERQIKALGKVKERIVHTTA